MASLVKVAAGHVSDRLPRRKPLVVAGYALSSWCARWSPAASAPDTCSLVRIADRIGKGVRGAPRDALLAEATSPGERGRAFGFHRAMDHAGAVVGPLLATGLLWLGADLRLVFALAAVPAAASLAVLVAGVREPPRREPADAPREAAVAGPVGGPMARYLAVLALFTLGNSSDAFLLLRAQEAGVPLAAIPALWAFHHVIKAAAGTHGGMLSDRLGRPRDDRLRLGGLCRHLRGVRVGHRGLARLGAVRLLRALPRPDRGARTARSSPASAPPKRAGRAFGLYHAVTGAMLLPASLLTGVLCGAPGHRRRSRPGRGARRGRRHACC